MDLKKNYIWMLSSRIVLIISTLITAGLINRALGPADRGFYAEMQTWVFLMIALAGFSLDTSIYHYSNSLLHKESDADKFKSALILNLIYSLVAIAVMHGLMIWQQQQFSSEVIKNSYLMCCWIIALMFANNLAVFFQARDLVVLSSKIGWIQAGLNLAIISATYFFKQLDLRMIVIVVILVQVVVTLCFIQVAVRLRWFSGKVLPQLVKGMFATGLKQHAATVSTFVYTKVNQLLLIKHCGATETGLYAVALSLVFALMVIPSTLQVVLYPRVIHNRDDFDITVRVIGLSFYIWGFCILLCAVLSKPLLFIYGGSEFLSGTGLFMVLLIMGWLLPLSSMISPYYIKEGAFFWASVSAVALGIISIIMNWYLIPLFGGMGAATATAISGLIGFIWAIIFLGYIGKRNPCILFSPGLFINSIKILWQPKNKNQIME